MRVLSIDRFEGNIAVCELENGEMINISKEKFPYSIIEGDVINVEVIYNGTQISDVKIYEKNEQEKQRRQQIIREKMSKINRF